MKIIFKVITVSLFSLSVFVSCENASSTVVEEQNGDGTTITFDVISLADESVENVQTIARSAATESVDSQPVIIAQEVSTTESEGFDAVVTVTEQADEQYANDNNVINNRVYKSASSENRQSLPLSASTTMATGIRYRVYLYENGNYVATIHAVAGTQSIFTGAYRNRTYTWFAYSYNSTADIPALTNTTTPTLTIPGDSGFLYASGSFTTSNVVNGNNKFNILFERKTSNIEVVIDARGMFGNILNLTGNSSNAAAVRSGTFNLLTGQYGTTYTGASTAVSFTSANFVNYNTEYGAMMKRISFYTAAGGQPITGWRFTFSALEIEGDRRTAPAALPGLLGWGIRIFLKM